MKTTKQTVIVIGLLASFSRFLVAAPLGTAFTFQGKLGDSGGSANGNYDLRFAIYDTASGGSPVAGPITNSPVAVANGLFTTTLDFGIGVFTGEAHWLEIAVRTNGVGGFATFPVRQRLTPAPAALYAPNAGTATSVANSAVTSLEIADGTISNADISASGIDASKIVGGDLRAGRLNVGTNHTLNGEWATIAGGNNNTASGPGAFVGGGGWGGWGQTASGTNSVVVGGLQNVASGMHATVGGGFLNKATGWGATVCGGEANNASADNATVGGGYLNWATNYYATVAGGRDNTVSGAKAAIGGGEQNAARSTHATVGGGWGNRAEGNAATVAGGGGYEDKFFGWISNRAAAKFSSVGGGGGNTVETNGDFSAIGGGYGNRISGTFATVPGGRENVAEGQYSFAAGLRAKALHTGAFVWASSTDADFASTDANQFLIRASGGVGLGTTAPAAQLHVAGDAIVGGTNFTASGHTARLILGDANHTVRSVYGGGLRFGVWPDANALTVQDSTANVGVGTATPGFKLHVNGDAGKPGGGAWSVASDARLKRSIQPLRGVLDKLLQLRGVSFEYRDSAAIHELPGERMGLIAQEVEPVFPDWVETGPDGMKRLTVRGFEALTIEALRQLREEKEARIAELERRNRTLESRLAALEQAFESARKNSAANAL